jgi:hypothetical protein
VAKAGRTFKMAIGPGLNQFRDNLLERWPEIRYTEAKGRAVASGSSKTAARQRMASSPT